MMFNQYPYINVNDLNLDYILSQIKVMMNEVTNFVSINAIKYADPIQWDITRQYEKNTVVIDPVTGTAYISVAPVPAGVALTRPEYWTVVFDLGSFVTRAAQNFTSHYESETTLTATFNTSTGGWLVWGDVLYKAITNITAGDSYVVDGNIEHFTIEDLYNAYLNTIATILAMIGDLQDLTTSDTSDIVHAINSVLNDLNLTVGDLATLTTSDKSSIVNAVNEIVGNLAQEITDRGNADNAIDAKIGNLADLTTTDKDSVVDAVNELKNDIDSIAPTSYNDIANTSGAVTRLLNMATSYLQNNNSLIYGNFHGAFNTNCTNEIDCSTFTELCLKGVSYENSRYSLGSNYDNILGSGYYFADEIIDPNVDRPFGMLANGICQFADEHGFGYEIDDIDEIRVGDILFVSNSPVPEYYKSVGHCGIIININKYNRSLLVISANNSNPSPIAIETWFLANTDVKYAARFPLQDSTMETNNLIAGYYTKNRSVTINIPAGQILGGIVQHLAIPSGYKTGEVYTMILTVDRLPIGMHLGLYGTCGGTYKFIQNMGGAGRDTVITSTFFIPADYNNTDTVNDLTGPYVRAVLDSALASAFSETFTIKSVMVVKGVAISNNEYFEMPAKDAIVTNYTLQNSYTITSDAELDAALLDIASNMINFTTKSVRIQVTGNTVTNITAGRYVVECFSYSGGTYGYFILKLISGYAANKKAIIYVTNTNGVLAYNDLLVLT